MLFMSSSFEKLDFIVEKIEDIESFRNRYKSIEDLLNDVMGYDATLMCLLQIGETLNKLRDEPFAEKLPIKGTYDVRNFIAHDYEGVNKMIIEDIIRAQLPKLKQTISTIKN
jgi:uncharacterized protein with HEPN domain